MEGDKIHNRTFPRFPHFNPLPPHGGRQLFASSDAAKRAFQSTPSAWRETGKATMQKHRSFAFQSTPSAWRETMIPLARFRDSVFQSTPSAWRETSGTGSGQPLGILFQSTPSAWRETLGTILTVWSGSISIHSLRMEGDDGAEEP